MKRVTQEKGFTLVELAIVMVIIGLLIGGILKGQELIKNAAVSATAAQLKAFESAYTTFVDIYGAKPGDLSTASTKIRACVAANRCRNGDGNGWIYNTNSALYPPGTDDQSVSVSEIYQALKHMAAADLIGGVNMTAAPGPDALVFSKLGGYLYLGEMLGNNTQYHLGAALGGTPGGIYVSQVGAHTWNPRTGRVLTPSETARLDRKIDDGVPGAGSMLAFGQATCVEGSSYNENFTEKVCSYAYKIR